MQTAESIYPRAESPLHWLQSPPTVSGSFRHRPEDFRVDEQLGFEPEGEGEHAYLLIEKVQANTRWVAWQLSKFAGVREMDVGYAGRKDRHSVSTQWFSCYLPGREAPLWQDMSIEGVSLKTHTRHKSKLRPGDLSGNRFAIVVRCATDDATRQDIDARLDLVKSAGFPNYFGDQRFGRDDQNLVSADKLLRLGERIKGDRGIVISAARSALFNDYVSRLLQDGDELTGNGPLYGRSRDPQPGEEWLDDLGAAWVAGLRKLKAKADNRPLKTIPEALSWQWQPDGVLIEFVLPAGSFATSLLREIFLLEDAAAPVSSAESQQ